MAQLLGSCESAITSSLAETMLGTATAAHSTTEETALIARLLVVLMMPLRDDGPSPSHDCDRIMLC